MGANIPSIVLSEMQAALAGPALTPRLVYDAARIERNLAVLQDWETRFGIKVFPSLKAFAHPVLTSHILPRLRRLELAAPNELEVATQPVTFKPSHSFEYSMAGPCWHLDPRFTADHPVARSTLLNCASQDQIDYALHTLKRSELGLRIAVPREKDPERQPLGSSSRFGFEPESLSALFETRPELRKVVRGFHFHRGSDINSATYLRRIADMADALATRYELNLCYVNLGGGLEKESEDALAGFFEANRYHKWQTAVEPGDFLFKGAGYLICRVAEISVRGSYLVVTVDASKECTARWSPVEFLGPQGGGTQQQILFFGSTCYENDLLCTAMCSGLKDEGSGYAPPFKVGEPILFGGITGYSASWQHSFNGTPLANIAIG